MVPLPEKLNIMRALVHSTAGNAVTSDVICCKNLHRVYFIVDHAGTNDTDLTLSLVEATTVAAATTAAVTATFPIWADTDHGTSSDQLVRQTDAASYVIDPALYGASLVVIEWDPAKHTAGYDCIYLSGASGHASNTVGVFVLGVPRYPAVGAPPTIITD